MEGYEQHHATSIVLFPVRKCSPIQRALLLFALRPDSTVGALMTVVQELAPVSNLVAYSEMECNGTEWNGMPKMPTAVYSRNLPVEDLLPLFHSTLALTGEVGYVLP